MESLKVYVQRFMEAMMKIERGSDECAMKAMQDGLKDEDFIRTISRNPPRAFSEMLVEAHKYISAEEIIESRRNSREGSEHINESKRNQQGGPLKNKRNIKEGNQTPRF